MVSKNYGDRYEVLTNSTLEEARDKQQWKRAFSCQTAMSQQHCLCLPPQGFTQDCIYQGSQLLDAVLSELSSSIASKIHRSAPCSTQTSTTTKNHVQHKLTLKTSISSFNPQHCHNCSLEASQQMADLQDRSSSILNSQSFSLCGCLQQ